MDVSISQNNNEEEESGVLLLLVSEACTAWLLAPRDARGSGGGKSAPPLLLLLLLFGPRTHNKTRELHFPPPLDALNSREGEQRCVSAAQSWSRALPR